MAENTYTAHMGSSINRDDTSEPLPVRRLMLNMVMVALQYVRWKERHPGGIYTC
jgi:hypothetical protein